MAQPGADTHAREEAETEFTRIVAFTDGVFAIAITLLVLTLEIPADKSDLGKELSERSSQFFAYFLSFAVLARFWLAHHRFYGAVDRFDSKLIALNMFYLAFVTLLPFTTEMLGNYSDDSLGVALYAANLTIVSASFVVQIKYCYAKRLMREDASDYEARFAGPANWAVAVVFAISIPIAFISPAAAQLCWLLLFILGRRVGDLVSGVAAPK